MSGFDPITGRRTHPTRVVRDADGNATYPDDPQVAAARINDREVPETQHSGYARGGTSSPVGDDDGSVKWYAPADPVEGGLGAEEDTAEPMFARDRETNPVPYEGRRRGPFADGTPVNAVDRDPQPGEVAAEEASTETKASAKKSASKAGS